MTDAAVVIFHTTWAPYCSRHQQGPPLLVNCPVCTVPTYYKHARSSSTKKCSRLPHHTTKSRPTPVVAISASQLGAKAGIDRSEARLCLGSHVPLGGTVSIFAQNIKQTGAGLFQRGLRCCTRPRTELKLTHDADW